MTEIINNLAHYWIISGIYPDVASRAAAGPSGFLSALLPRCLAPGRGHTNRPPVLLLLLRVVAGHAVQRGQSTC